MKELVIVVQIDRGGEEAVESLDQIRNAIIAVVALCDVAVETLVVSDIHEVGDE